MEKLVECVPNFSEGRNLFTITAISKSVEEVPGVVLLGVDSGKTTNRTVITFAGSPEAVGESAFLAIKTASHLIDMRKHKGAHPRIGAVDVCPFVPLQNVSLDECVTLARNLGEKVGDELGIPVYLYEFAAFHPGRKNLAEIRKGEYEGLKQKLKDPRWKPDFGQGEFNFKSGAIAIGARDILIAFNINLGSHDQALARRIASKVRKKLQNCKAIGWMIEEYEKAQVSLNLTNYHITPLHSAFESVKQMASDEGIQITGSEIVGLVPLKAMLMAGEYFYHNAHPSGRGKKGLATSEEKLMQMAIDSLGLDDVSVFNPEEKILEYRLRAKRFLE